MCLTQKSSKIGSFLRASIRNVLFEILVFQTTIILFVWKIVFSGKSKNFFRLENVFLSGKNNNIVFIDKYLKFLLWVENWFFQESVRNVFV